MTVSTQSLPKAVQVSEMLIREIAAGRLVDGARLPTERQMARDLGIAVGTLRRALAILEEKGLLTRVQGSGNYVRSKRDIQSVYSFFRLEKVEGGGLPSAEVLEVLRLRKTKEMPDIGKSEWAHRIRRLRFLGGDPVAFEEIWLDFRFCDRLNANDLNESLYLHYKDKLGLIISHVTDRIGVSNLPDWPNVSLNMQTGSPCGYVERIGKDQDGMDAEYSRTWFDQTTARYTVRR
ncbi:MAG: GntR family transcriptional regulator [Pseudomonadota bacterium]